MADHGYPLTKTMAKAYAWAIVSEQEKEIILIQKLVLEADPGRDVAPIPPPPLATHLI